MASTIKIEGLDKLVEKLGKFDAVDVLETPMQRATLRVQDRMLPYPPPPSRSTYVRKVSAGLQGHWTTRVTRTAGGLEGQVGNNMPYAPLVQSPCSRPKRTSARAGGRMNRY